MHFTVEGPAKIAAVGNGNPQSLEPFVADSRALFFGKAMLIVRAKRGERGGVRITAKSSGLKTAQISITVN